MTFVQVLKHLLELAKGFDFVHIRCVLFELGHCPQVKKINVLARGYNDECPGLVIITGIKEGVKKRIR